MTSSELVLNMTLVVCGAAPTSVALIIGRAIAGVGAAGIFSGALVYVLLESLFRLSDRVLSRETCLGRSFFCTLRRSMASLKRQY